MGPCSSSSAGFGQSFWSTCASPRRRIAAAKVAYAACQLQAVTVGAPLSGAPYVPSASGCCERYPALLHCVITWLRRGKLGSTVGTLRDGRAQLQALGALVWSSAWGQGLVSALCLGQRQHCLAQSPAHPCCASRRMPGVRARCQWQWHLLLSERHSSRQHLVLVPRQSALVHCMVD